MKTFQEEHETDKNQKPKGKHLHRRVLGYKIADFVNQYRLVDPDTRNFANVVLVREDDSNGHLSVVFDIETANAQISGLDNWDAIEHQLLSLRQMRNRIFMGGLTEKCLNLFQ